MSGSDGAVFLYGTEESRTRPRHVQLGDLSILIDAEMIRSICWRGVEVVRAIGWPIRDANWITLAQDGVDKQLDVTADAARFTLSFSVDQEGLECRLQVDISDKGHISARLDMLAKRDFATNRAGFTVLHPISGVAGTDLEIRHSDGTSEASAFPRAISPGQPAFDIVGLTHTVDDVTVDIAFTGEVFEMEDQRNWTDASYKTYCKPLVFPFTYTIPAGETVSQAIDITLAGGTAPAAGAAASDLTLEPANDSAPAIALAVEANWLASGITATLIDKIAAGALQIRCGPSPETDYLTKVARLADDMNMPVDVELALPSDLDTITALRNARQAFEAVGLAPARLLALPETYLASYQPLGPWPEGPTPDHCVDAAKAVFSDVEIGGGVLTNFTEFNRCRPDPKKVDYISHGTTAIVHAADDQSVLETLEALPHIFESARALAGDVAYRVGLVSIGMRSNPYGASTADNPSQIRQTMAKDDPRQRGLFAAGFAVCALAATQDHQVEAIALAAPAGPFGIVSANAAHPRPYFDSDRSALVYPLYHVVRAAASMSGKTRLAIHGLPTHTGAYAVGDDFGARLMLVNLGASDVNIRLPGRPVESRVLDQSSFVEAMRDPDWLEKSPARSDAALKLAPLAVAFCDLGAV